jgi:hypothetical protein
MGFIILKKKKKEVREEEEEISQKCYSSLKSFKVKNVKKAHYIFDIIMNVEKRLVKMKASRGEIKICDILSCSGLPYKEEYSFDDLLSNRGAPLRFDFAVFDDEGEIDFLIEYQGIQHYEPKSKFGGVGGLRKQQYNDMLKREYCEKHGIPLVIIPYWDEGRIDYDYIMSAAGY